MGMNPQSAAVIAFIQDLSLSDVPPEVARYARYLMLDLLGVAAAGRQTRTADIICNYVAGSMAAGAGQPAVPILFDGRAVSPSGAALAGGMIIDAIDAHDGYKPAKGHVGCALLPSVLAALCATGQLQDEEALLTALIAGYEVGSRCGVALHRTAPDYHTSGAWMAVAVAGVVARIYGLDAATSWQAMGIAEYHGPRSQMMRVIDHTTMLKDGSGWGALAGVSAVEMAALGFTGAPALIIGDEACSDLWENLGSEWLLPRQYIKLWPVCRWAQPAMQAVLSIWAEAAFDIEQIASIEIETFHESLRLASPHPASPDEAQYSLCWPVAALLVALAEGREFAAYDIGEAALGRADIHALSDKISLVENDDFNKVFPELRQSRLHIDFTDGSHRNAFCGHTKGDPETPVSRAELTAKFDRLIAVTPLAEKAEALQRACLASAETDKESNWNHLLFEADN
jgi:2-methylcitrate dehydratase PrpD